MYRYRTVKILSVIVVSLGWLFCFLFSSAAESDEPKPIKIAVPAETISSLIEDLLPYQIPMVKGFSGSLWVQKVESLKFGTNKAMFFAKIMGKDLEFSTKIGKQLINLKFGEANVSSNCEASFRYDKERKSLLITPQVKEFVDTDRSGQAGEILMPLLKGLSGIEYSVKLQSIDPIITTYENKIMTINLDISDVYSENNILFIHIIPSVEMKPNKGGVR